MNEDFNKRMQQYLSDKGGDAGPSAGPVEPEPSPRVPSQLDFAPRKAQKARGGIPVIAWVLAGMFLTLSGGGVFLLNEARAGRVDLKEFSALTALNTVIWGKKIDAWQILPAPPAGWAIITQADVAPDQPDPNAALNALDRQLPDWPQQFAGNFEFMGQVMGIGLYAKKAANVAQGGYLNKYGIGLYAGGGGQTAVMELRMGAMYQRFGERDRPETWVPAYQRRANSGALQKTDYVGFQFAGFPAVMRKGAAAGGPIDDTSREMTEMEFSVLFNYRTELRIKATARPADLKKILGGFDQDQIVEQVKSIGQIAELGILDNYIPG